MGPSPQCNDDRCVFGPCTASSLTSLHRLDEYDLIERHIRPWRAFSPASLQARQRYILAKRRDVFSFSVYPLARPLRTSLPADAPGKNRYLTSTQTKRNDLRSVTGERMATRRQGPERNHARAQWIERATADFVDLLEPVEMVFALRDGEYCLSYEGGQVADDDRSQFLRFCFPGQSGSISSAKRPLVNVCRAFFSDELGLMYLVDAGDEYGRNLSSFTPVPDPLYVHSMCPPDSPAVRDAHLYPSPPPQHPLPLPFAPLPASIVASFLHNPLAHMDPCISPGMQHFHASTSWYYPRQSLMVPYFVPGTWGNVGDIGTVMVEHGEWKKWDLHLDGGKPWGERQERKVYWRGQTSGNVCLPPSGISKQGSADSSADLVDASSMARLSPSPPSYAFKLDNWLSDALTRRFVHREAQG